LTTDVVLIDEADGCEKSTPTTLLVVVVDVGVTTLLSADDPPPPHPANNNELANATTEAVFNEFTVSPSLFKNKY
jgi:hypothetical protein